MLRIEHRLIVSMCALTTVAGAADEPKRTAVFQAEHARLNAERVEIVSQESFQGHQGVARKAGIDTASDADQAPPDLAFTVIEPSAGRFTISTVAATDASAASQMRKATSKQASLYARIQVGPGRPTRRVVFVPWSPPDFCFQSLGIFNLTNGAQEIKFWLPSGVRLDRLEIHPYRPPSVPAEASHYSPEILPPPYHPRLWVNSNSLPIIRARLTHPENLGQWASLRASAARPFAFTFIPEREVAYNTPLENAATAKAFAYLMQGDAKLGREAVALMRDYLPRVEFGNLLDITREVGAAIYSAAIVYDWCYGLMTPAERALLRTHMMRLADDMECGWPPFKGTIVNGHGNEAMVNRDLLAMGIALYDEDPVPYQYCAYKILEQLVPMRRFEYQSPRHSQGVSYAAYRFGWEMHAAWLFRRMTDREVFDANIKTVPSYWLYMRLPNGEMLRDGDGVPNGPYWGYSQTALLCYAYSGDPVIKGEFQRQARTSVNPWLFLLLNDPAIRAEPRLDGLPLTIGFGHVLGGLVARTGWAVGTNSNDVVAEIKGGGYHFGNHQHADAGALQVYYRGLQVADLGLYKFYGTPYDMNFNKRSIAHSMMLVVDPHEKFLSASANDGGSRFLQSCPTSRAQVIADPTFHYGQTISCAFGPHSTTPDFSYYSVDLTEAYSKKVTSFTRSFCFLNLNRADHPAAMILLDRISSADPAFKKCWQINTLQAPQRTPHGVLLHNAANGVTGRLDVAMLWPRADSRTVAIKSGDEAYDVFGKTVTPPTPTLPEASGHRIMFSPAQPNRNDTFLVLMQACDASSAPLSRELTESPRTAVLRIADRIVCLAKETTVLSEPFSLHVPADGTVYRVCLTGLAPGEWSITPGDVSAAWTAAAEAGKNTLFFTSRGGEYTITPRLRLPVTPTHAATERQP